MRKQEKRENRVEKAPPQTMAQTRTTATADAKGEAVRDWDVRPAMEWEEEDPERWDGMS